MGKPLILFDLDGTIVDTETIAMEVTERYFAKQGIALSRVDLLVLVGRAWKPSVEILLSRHLIGKDVATTETEILTDYRAALAEELPEIQGSCRAIRELSAHFQLGLVSNSRRQDIEAVLKGLGVSSHFTHIVGFEDVLHGKPSPEPYETAVAKFGVEKNCVLVFEDSKTGVEAAQAAGLQVVAIGSHPDATAGRAATPWHIEDFSEVDVAWANSRFRAMSCPRAHP